LYECEAVGHHRMAAMVENNMAFPLLSLGSFKEAKSSFYDRAGDLNVFPIVFDEFKSTKRSRVYTLKPKQYTLAQEVIEQAVETLEITDGEAFLAEALTTAGVLAVRQRRFIDAKKSFEASYKVAERCGDNEGAGRAY